MSEASNLSQAAPTADAQQELKTFRMSLVSSARAKQPRIIDCEAEEIIELIRDELKLEVQERQIDRTELYLADEAFFCGTGAQISAITRVDYRPIGTGQLGAVTARLRAIFFDVVRGRIAKYRSWCCPVYESKQTATTKERSRVTVE